MARIAPDAVFWFTDGSHVGRDAIAAAFGRTRRTIEDDRCARHGVRWLVREATTAVCVYAFTAEGRVRGRPFAAGGRGTTAIARRPEGWRVLHKHLSPE